MRICWFACHIIYTQKREKAKAGSTVLGAIWVNTNVQIAFSEFFEIQWVLRNHLKTETKGQSPFYMRPGQHKAWSIIVGCSFGMCGYQRISVLHGLYPIYTISPSPPVTHHFTKKRKRKKERNKHRACSGAGTLQDRFYLVCLVPHLRAKLFITVGWFPLLWHASSLITVPKLLVNLKRD